MQRWVADRYGDQDMFDFHCVNINENRDLVANYVEAIGLDTPVILGNNALWNQYQLRGGISPYPVDYIIDGDGIIQYANHEYEPEIIVMTIDRLLDIQDEAPRIFANPDTLDFGMVNIGESAELPIQVRNGGNADLIVTNCLIEGDYFDVVFEEEFTIAPGNRRDIAISFFPEDSTAIGLLIATATFYSNDPEQGEISVHLIGRGLDPFNARQEEDRNIPREFFLSPAYPNPFNSSTTFSYGLPVASDVELRVYDIAGKIVSTIISGKWDAGYHSVIWDAADVPAGVYFVRLRAGEFHSQQKAVSVR